MKIEHVNLMGKTIQSCYLKVVKTKEIIRYRTHSQKEDRTRTVMVIDFEDGSSVEMETIFEIKQV